MKLRMAENSLFAILLRKPWWISILIAVALSLALAAALPRGFAPYGASAGFPFLVIGIIAAVRQLRAPSPARVERTLEQLRGMSWAAFSQALEQAFRAQGDEVTRQNGAADFAVGKAGRTALVSARRWKAASIGVDALRELHAAVEKAGAQEGIYLGLGEVSEAARHYADRHRIRLLGGTELVRLMQSVVK